MLLHLHRPTLFFVAPPVALLVLLSAVVDASAAGALLQRFGLANCTFPTHFARKTSIAARRCVCVLNKAAGVWVVSRYWCIERARMALYFGRVPLCVGGLFLQASEVSSCASIKAIGIATHISAATFYARRRDPFTRQTSCIQTISRVICGRKWARLASRCNCLYFSLARPPPKRNKSRSNLHRLMEEQKEINRLGNQLMQKVLKLYCNTNIFCNKNMQQQINCRRQILFLSLANNVFLLRQIFNAKASGIKRRLTQSA
jgi:hypothetical protein